MSLTVEPAELTFSFRQDCDVEFLLRSDAELTVGDTVEFQFPNSWSLVSGPSFTRVFQADDPAGEHYVGVSAAGATFEVTITGRHLYGPEGTFRHGRLIAATLAEGVVQAGAPIRIVYANTYAPYVAEAETLWVRVAGEAPEVAPRLVTAGGPATHVRILLPSGAEPGEGIEALVVSLDECENCSTTRYENRTLTTTDGDVIAEGLTFTGRVRVPVRFDEPGVHRVAMDGVVSNAVRVAAGRRGPFWGDTHIHTRVSHDAQGADPYGYARQVAALDFAAVADHVNSMGEDGYAQIERWAEEAHVPGEFVTFPADERIPPGWTGHHNVYCRDVEAFRALKATEINHAGGDFDGPAAAAEVGPDRVMAIPHHTGISWGTLPGPGGLGSAVDWDAADDGGLRTVMEIYSHHGQSEVYSPHHILAYEFNRMRVPGRRTNVSVPGPHYAQDFWRRGVRVGVIGSSDEHSGQGGRRHGGIGAVWADALTREGVWDALRARRCYATTGERILVEFTVGGVPMGEAVTRNVGDVLPIRLDVWGTDLLARVDVLRYRFGVDEEFLPIVSGAPNPASMDFTCEIEDECTGPAVYYARVVQDPLEWPAMAWTSPVWIDAA